MTDDIMQQSLRLMKAFLKLTQAERRKVVELAEDYAARRAQTGCEQKVEQAKADE